MVLLESPSVCSEQFCVQFYRQVGFSTLELTNLEFDHSVAFATDNTRDPFYGFGDLDMSKLLSRSQYERIVLRNGQVIDTTLPDYAELDDLYFNKSINSNE